ncbi:transcriptional regulator, TetR family [Aquiflexum balticum DSM 16537]|uniref:Transcriptional regulator, TetR family n=1 Tax=Aquiflexum balticum DSM 16537 TaxID=758820 RepID=A0A1W2H4J3_9BACT|nr:TetR/AcrR family transcriptional regulator [Aquiflexum balticum]SMD43855.1 transcriptional regulator, TetR family [Aquiflexum balticum DSM 16537]
MGLVERKIREKEELKESILKAAKRLFLKKGFEKTSIRNIADEIEYSPGIIYHYFKDKNEIFHELHSEGFQELYKRMEILGAVADPMSRLKAMGRIYIQFGLENTDMYDLMFIIEAPIDHVETCADQRWDDGDSTFNLLRGTVKECMLSGHFQGHRLEALSFMIWATVHGMVSLKIRKRVNILEISEVENIVENSYQSFLIILDKL